MRFLVVMSVLFSSSAYSFGYDHYKAYGCFEDPVFHCELIADEDLYYEPDLEAAKRDGRSIKHLVSAVIDFTGMSFGAVTSTLDAVRGECVSKGYTKFEATLSGPAGKASFTYHLNSGEWTVSHAPTREPSGDRGGFDHGDKPRKRITE